MNYQCNKAIFIGACLLAATATAMAVPFTIGGVNYAPSGLPESVTAVFTAANGGSSAHQYSGLVLLSVSGTGQSDGSAFNDAFYVFSPGPISHDPDFYQLVVDTTPLVPRDSAHDAYRSMVYDVDAGTAVSPGHVPAYQASHIYNFVLDTHSSVLSTLYFGVNDGVFSDNSGAYQIEVSQLAPVSVPEAGSTLPLLGLGFISLACGARRRAKSTQQKQ